ncbi:MAG TPA: M14 metallopeptidase family protein [Blastocatellia bacterium]|nr:M14 metallopeptidase family protein [Blastocatellia bacterium]
MPIRTRLHRKSLVLTISMALLGAFSPGKLIEAISAAKAPPPASWPPAAPGKVPSPRDVLGFTPGDDRKLASWDQFVDYFKRLDQASDRVVLQELGRTTLNRPFMLAVISSPANLARLDRFREIQRRLADPRALSGNQGEAEKLIAEGRAVVLITCGIHSTEVGANLVSMNIAHRLASDDSPDTRDILEKCIVLLVPSLNPDGVDIVKNWYDKTLGTPAEGTGPPELYHHYTGHDNNRDWYAFTQVETRMTVDKVHNVWHPQIVHDIHQQGERGTRFFIPPYVEPWEPNVPPLIQAGVNFMGSSMAWEMASEGKAGVVTNGVYDAWTPGRAYQHYHAGIRILSETASARLASPITVPFDRQTPQINVDPKVRSWNYPLLWQGGEWRMADIVAYQQSGAFALMRNAAKHREKWLRDFYQIGKDAVRARRAGETVAFLIPPEKSPGGWREFGLSRLESILARGGVEIKNAAAGFEAGGVKYPEGTRIIFMNQPYGAFAKTLLERQQYPDLREYPGGPPRRPYDVTAHTLPLLMGVNVVEATAPFEAQLRDVRPAPPDPRLLSAGGARLGVYQSFQASMDEGWTRWVLDQHGIKYSSLLDREIRRGGLRARYDCILIPDQRPRQIVDGLPKDRYPEEVSGGIGAAGVRALNEFVEEGGTIITLNGASDFAVEQLGAPVTKALEGVAPRDFYCPGSILKIKFDPESRLARGVPPLGSSRDETIAWFETGSDFREDRRADTSTAFEPRNGNARVIARFADAKELLLSGWLLGAEKLAGKGAIVEVKKGKGRVILFAYRPQYRGQSVASFPFLFNAIATSRGE